jgi:hypothetical protein
MWSAVAVTKRSVQPDGSALVVAEVSDADGLAHTITVTLTSGGALSVLCKTADGADPLAGFEAWSV